MNGPTNDERAERGRRLLATYGRLTPEGKYHPQDAIADILHAVRRDRGSTDEAESVLRIAGFHFEAETLEDPDE